jgi:hypothetical protein
VETSERRLEGLRRFKKDKSLYEGYLQQISENINGLDPELQSRLGGIIGVLS